MAENKVVQVKFNLENEQDRMKWEHISKKNNRQSYIKDLILADMLYDLFNHPDDLGKTKGSKKNK